MSGGEEPLATGGSMAKAGILKKRGGKLRTKWQSRYCWLQDGVLRYSKTQGSKELGNVQVRGAWLHLFGDAEHTGHDNLFGLMKESKNKLMLFAAASPEDKQEWIDALLNEGARDMTTRDGLKQPNSGEAKSTADTPGSSFAQSQSYLRPDSVVEGTVYTLTSGGKSWAKRYVVISAEILRIYKAKTDPRPQDEHYLRQCSVKFIASNANQRRRALRDVSKFAWQVDIRRVSQPLVLAAGCREDRDKWSRVFLQCAGTGGNLDDVVYVEEDRRQQGLGVIVNPGMKRNPNSVLEGHLRKIGGRIRTVHHRLFELTADRLSYYASMKSLVPKGVIMLHNAEVRVLDTSPTKSKDDYCFSIKPSISAAKHTARADGAARADRGLRTYVIICTTPQERTIWVEKIAEMIIALDADYGWATNPRSERAGSVIRGGRGSISSRRHRRQLSERYIEGGVLNRKASFINDGGGLLKELNASRRADRKQAEGNVDLSHSFDSGYVRTPIMETMMFQYFSSTMVLLRIIRLYKNVLEVYECPQHCGSVVPNLPPTQKPLIKYELVDAVCFSHKLVTSKGKKRGLVITAASTLTGELEKNIHDADGSAKGGGRMKSVLGFFGRGSGMVGGNAGRNASVKGGRNSSIKVGRHASVKGSLKQGSVSKMHTADDGNTSKMLFRAAVTPMTAESKSSLLAQSLQDTPGDVQDGADSTKGPSAEGLVSVADGLKFTDSKSCPSLAFLCDSQKMRRDWASAVRKRIDAQRLELVDDFAVKEGWVHVVSGNGAVFGYLILRPTSIHFYRRKPEHPDDMTIPVLITLPLPSCKITLEKQHERKNDPCGYVSLQPAHKPKEKVLFRMMTHGSAVQWYQSMQHALLKSQNVMVELMFDPTVDSTVPIPEHIGKRLDQLVASIDTDVAEPTPLVHSKPTESILDEPAPLLLDEQYEDALQESPTISANTTPQRNPVMGASPSLSALSSQTPKFKPAANAGSRRGSVAVNKGIGAFDGPYWQYKVPLHKTGLVQRFSLPYWSKTMGATQFTPYHPPPPAPYDLEFFVSWFQGKSQGYMTASLPPKVGHAHTRRRGVVSGSSAIGNQTMGDNRVGRVPARGRSNLEFYQRYMQRAQGVVIGSGNLFNGIVGTAEPRRRRRKRRRVPKGAGNATTTPSVPVPTSGFSTMRVQRSRGMSLQRIFQTRSQSIPAAPGGPGNGEEWSYEDESANEDDSEGSGYDSEEEDFSTDDTDDTSSSSSDENNSPSDSDSDPQSRIEESILGTSLARAHLPASQLNRSELVSESEESEESGNDEITNKDGVPPVTLPGTLSPYAKRAGMDVYPSSLDGDTGATPKPEAKPTPDMKPAESKLNPEVPSGGNTESITQTEQPPEQKPSQESGELGNFAGPFATPLAFCTHLSTQVEVKDRKAGLFTTLRSCFVGEELVNWLMAARILKADGIPPKGGGRPGTSRETAVKYLVKLQELGLLVPVAKNNTAKIGDAKKKSYDWFRFRV